MYESYFDKSNGEITAYIFEIENNSYEGFNCKYFPILKKIFEYGKSPQTTTREIKGKKIECLIIRNIFGYLETQSGIRRTHVTLNESQTNLLKRVFEK